MNSIVDGEHKPISEPLGRCVAPGIEVGAPLFDAGTYDSNTPIDIDFTEKNNADICPKLQLPTANDENIPNKKKAEYKWDASYLAVKYMEQLNNSSIEIPACLTQIYYRALIHVYNSQGTCRDIVVNRYEIHGRGRTYIKGLELLVNCKEKWFQQWKKGEKQTSHNDIDKLIKKYELSIYDLVKTTTSCNLLLLASRPINTYSLGRRFSEIEGINKAIFVIYGDGNQINAEFTQEKVIIEYVLGFGDCPSGCMYSYRTRFEVDKRGRVKVIGIYGTEPNQKR